VVSGELKVKLPGERVWRRFGTGSHFVVGAGQTFQLQVPTATAYFCTYE